MRRTPTPFESVGIIWGSVAVASLLSALFTASRLPSFLETFVSRPIAIVVVVLISSLIASEFLRVRFEVLLGDCVRFVPSGLLIGLGLSLVGIWNDGSGTTALRLSDAGLFALTFGAFPFKLGPEIFLRGTVVALAFILAFHLLKQKIKPATVVTVFAASWIGGAAVLLIQTWMAHWSALTNRLTISHSQDAVRALGLLHVNSYWSTFQADRFFAGIEKQLETSIELSSVGVLFLIGIGVLAIASVLHSPISQRTDFIELIKEKMPAPLISFVLAASPFVGIGLGWKASRWSWNALDAIAVLLLGVLIAAWFGLRVFSQSEFLFILIMIASFLLGWPVFFLTLTLLALTRLMADNSLFLFGTKFGSSIEYGFSAAIFVILGGAFIARNALFPLTIGYWAIGMALLAFFLALRQKAQRP